MRLQVSEIPYSAEDEQRNIAILQDGSKEAYSLLLQRNAQVIRMIAKRFEGYFKIDVPFQELEMYAMEGFFLAGRSFNFRTSFIEYAVFYTAQHLFYQVYTEYFLSALPMEKRIGMQQLYTEVLKHLDSGSGVNYYEAIVEAADTIGMALSEAIELMVMLSQMSVSKPDENRFMEELDKLSTWVYRKDDKKSVCAAPLPLVLIALEANLQKRKGTDCIVPFKSICETFGSIATAVKQKGLICNEACI